MQLNSLFYKTQQSYRGKISKVIAVVAIGVSGYVAMVAINKNSPAPAPVPTYMELERLSQPTPGIYPGHGGYDSHPEIPGSYSSPTKQFYFVEKEVTFSQKDQGIMLHTLFEQTENGWEARWSNTYNSLPGFDLPDVIVSDRGEVILMDQSGGYINIQEDSLGLEANHQAAQKAIARIGEQPLLFVYGKDGSTLASYTLANLAEVLNSSPQKLLVTATTGYWRQSPPRFDSSKETVMVNSGGKVLAIKLETGLLSVY